MSRQQSNRRGKPFNNGPALWLVLREARAKRTSLRSQWIKTITCPIPAMKTTVCVLVRARVQSVSARAMRASVVWRRYTPDIRISCHAHTYTLSRQIAHTLHYHQDIERCWKMLWKMYEFLRTFLKDVIYQTELRLVKFFFEIHIFQGIPGELQRLSARLSLSFRKELFFC